MPGAPGWLWRPLRSAYQREAAAPIFFFCPGTFSPVFAVRRGVLDFRIHFRAYKDRKAGEVQPDVLRFLEEQLIRMSNRGMRTAPSLSNASRSARGSGARDRAS